MSSSQNALLVTTSARGSSRTQVWDEATPLTIGHPFRWVLERSESGVRIREIAAPGNTGKLRKGAYREISYAEIEKGFAADFSSMNFQIRPARKATAAFQSNEGNRLAVFPCVGNWVLQAQMLDDRFVGTTQKEQVFTLSRTGADYRVEAMQEGVSVAQGDAEAQPLSKGQSLQISGQGLVDTRIHCGVRSWRFGPVAVPTYDETKVRDPEAARDPEVETFKKTLRYTAIGLIAFTALTWIWPKPKQDPSELIPAQYTKVILAKPQKSGGSGSAGNNMPEGMKNVPRAVQDAAVVQAFRAKALSNAVNGLLKGGMAKLLAQSDVVMGQKNRDNARRMFDTQDSSLRPTATDVGMMNSKNVKVASLGGGMGMGEGGSGVGYGKGAGKGAGVAGQGSGFVPFVGDDASGSSVDEGLTKDEVGEVIHKHLSEVRYCYEAAIIRTADIEGKLTMAFTIGGNGTVKTADIKSSTLSDSKLDDCILRRLLTWKFPNPRKGVDVSVTYPFVFKTLGR